MFMNSLTLINKVSADLAVSSRTLRYWEGAGLFTSGRDPQSGWRVYDERALERIRVTLLLRRLDFSIGDIKEIIDKQTVESLCQILRKQLGRLTKAGSDLETRRTAISGLIAILEGEETLTLSSLENLLLPVAVERKKHLLTKQIGGEKMDDINSKYGDVCIVTMPPMRTAAYSCVSPQPEKDSIEVIKKWIADYRLESTARLFGFHTPPYNSTDDDPGYGFGFFAAVSEDVAISEPLYEKRLPGGLYAVFSEYDGDPMYAWDRVMALFKDSEWEWEWDTGRHPEHPGFEEHIDRADGKGDFYLRVHVPVKRKQ